MHFINTLSLFCRLVGISLLFIGITPTYADTLDSRVELSATPHLCLTDANSQICEIDIVLSWEITSDELVCIISDYEAMPRWCATSADTRSLSLKIKSDKDIQFVLVTKKNNVTLAGTKVKITKSSTSKVRRRYRNPWSLF